MPSDDEDTNGTQSVPDDDSQDVMYPVIEILAENKIQYQVRWEGNDPTSGKPWGLSWIPKEDASEGLVEHWQQKKARKAQRKRRSKSGSSKTKARARVTGNKSTSRTPSTSVSSHKISKPESVLSISSTSTVDLNAGHSNRKRRASPHCPTTSSIADESVVLGFSRPRKKQKLEVLHVSSSPEPTQSTYEVTLNKKFGKIVPEDEDADSSQIIPSNTIIKGKGKQRAIADDDSSPTDTGMSHTKIRPAGSDPVNEISPVKVQDGSATSRGSSERRVDSPHSTKVASNGVHTSNDGDSVVTANIPFRLRQEEEENTQEARVTVAQRARDSDMSVPHIHFSRTKHPKSKHPRHIDHDVVGIKSNSEDISVEPSEHADIIGVDFDSHNDYGVDPAQDLAAIEKPPSPVLPQQAVHFELSQSHPPSTPPHPVRRCSDTGSMIKSRMKGNKSTPGGQSPTKGPYGGDNTSSKIYRDKDEAVRISKPPKTLRPLPAVTPSKFAPYLPQSEAPMSSIEDFSPDNTRSTQGKNVTGETDDIVQEDSLTDNLLKQRGLELADQAAMVQRRERKRTGVVRRHLNTATASTSLMNDIPLSPDSNRPTSREHQQTDKDLLQEMEDTYVDLSGGYPEDISMHGNGAKEMNKVLTSQADPSSKLHRSEEELTPTDSIQANTDDQGQSQESEISKSQQLENAVNVLHAKSEEIESLQNQLLEQHAQHNVLQTDLDRLQNEQEALIVQELMQRNALAEAKDHIKSLDTRIELSTRQREAWDKDKAQLIVARDEERNKWIKESVSFIHQIDSLEKQKADLEKSILDHVQCLKSSEGDWLQKESAWDCTKESWLGEKREWLEKENTWQAEKETLQERIQDRGKEKETLEAESRSAKSDSEFFRNQYATASAFTDSVRAENMELQKQNDEFKKQAKIAHGQANVGVQLVKETYQSRVKKLEEELEKTKRLCEFLRTKDERTNDEIRRLAALYPELSDENTKLRQEVKELSDLRGRMTRVLEDVSDDYDGYGDEGANARSSPGSLEYEDDVIFEDSRRIPDEEKDDGSERYLCQWKWCNNAFDGLLELSDHIASSHDFE